MSASWKQLAFTPSHEAVSALMDAWNWLFREPLSPFMFAASGDVFLEASDQSIHWLDTGQGTLTRVAASREAFLGELRKDQGTEWLLAPVVDRLLHAGKHLGRDQCYSFKRMPVLGGDYSVENMVPMDAASWYGFSGYVHLQIKDLPEGSNVEFKFE